MTMHTDRSLTQMVEDWSAYFRGCFEEPYQDYVNIHYFNQLLKDLLGYIARLEDRIRSLEADREMC